MAVLEFLLVDRERLPPSVDFARCILGDEDAEGDPVCGDASEFDSSVCLTLTIVGPDAPVLAAVAVLVAAVLADELGQAI
eukprot:jgi/Hompol1/6429/HPOL_002894-RA